MRTFNYLGLLLGVTVVSTAASATPPPGGGGPGTPGGVTYGYNETGVVSRQLSITSVIPEFPTADKPVSGTNVNFVVRTVGGLLASPPYMGTDGWNWIRVDHAWLTLTDADDSTYPPLSVDTAPIGILTNYVWLSSPITMNTVDIPCRFASTYFPSGHHVNITFSVQYTFGRGSQQSPTETYTTTPSKTVRVLIYNQAVLESTREVFTPPSGPYVEDESSPNLYSCVSQVGALYARGVLLPNTDPGMRHTCWPTLATDQRLMTKADIQANLALRTFFFGFTHGSPDGFRTSGGDSLTWDEVETAIGGYRTDNPPPFNMVLMYASRTLSVNNPPLEQELPGVNYQAPLHFKILDASSNIRPDMVYTGFKGWPAYCLDANNVQYPLYYHSNLLMDRLAAFDTIDEAVATANASYMPYDVYHGTTQPLLIVGDPYSRIRKVYAETAARLQAWRNLEIVFPCYLQE